MAEFRVPSLGADMEAGTLVEWLKRPGDRVKRGDVIAVVETQKGAIEVDIFEDGVIERWLVEPGTTVPVGTPLALIGGGPSAGRAPEIAAATVLGPAAPLRPVQLPAVPLPLEPEPRGAPPACIARRAPAGCRTWDRA
jgi:pyruvate dehydrogenase E2 component (dihydrolipoamide acetyltransferase)